MSDIKLRAARQLIAEEQTAAARRVLETMPANETAQGWLAKLNEMSAEEPGSPEAPVGGWEYLEVFVKASERQQADAGIVLAGQTFTTVEHFYTRKLNELGAPGLGTSLRGTAGWRFLPATLQAARSARTRWLV